MSNLKLWAADPHRFGPGKIHFLDPDKPTHTFCGKVLAAFPGRPIVTGEATCQMCRQAPIRRAERKAAELKAKRDFEDFERQKEIEQEQWWAAYELHLKSDKWRALREAVFRRCHGVCEGCAKTRAVQVHHLTYEHMGNELLWELVGVCDECHERAHQPRNEISEPQP